ncbi:hypothetical protein SSS_03401 [Sarcoptes scabiei]|nr:hypothetical protein SSS_03401 [Sarcoptes scabiei]
MFDSNKFEALQSDYSDHVRQVMKVTAMIGARAVRKWFQKLPEDRKKNILANFFQHRWKLVTVISIIVLSSIYYYQSHLQETILTKRRRLSLLLRVNSIILTKLNWKQN